MEQPMFKAINRHWINILMLSIMGGWS